MTAAEGINIATERHESSATNNAILLYYIVLKGYLAPVVAQQELDLVRLCTVVLYVEEASSLKS